MKHSTILAAIMAAMLWCPAVGAMAQADVRPRNAFKVSGGLSVVLFRIMKKLLLFLTLVCPSIVFQSCNEEEEPDVDRNPVQIIFFVEDAEGNDLLDPENPNAFGPEDITITCTERAGWDSQAYHVGSFNGSVYIGPGFQVSTLKYDLVNQYIILIGDYSSQYLASMPIKNIEIEWPDGSKDYIVLTYSEHRSGNGFLKQNVHIFLNGVEMPYPYPFTIVK